MVKKWLVALGIVSLSGCSLFGSDAPIMDTYTIGFPCPHNVPARNNAVTLMVSTPTASSGYHTKKMIYNQCPYQLSSFTKTEWAGPPAEMLEPLMIQKLRNTGFFHAVVATPFSAKREYVLKSHLLELRQDFTQKPSHLILAMQVEIINQNTDQVINSKTFCCNVPTRCDTPYSGVGAANYCANKLLDEVAQFAVQSIGKY